MADHPKRIQLQRTKGWRKPKGADVVSRHPVGATHGVSVNQTPGGTMSRLRRRAAVEVYRFLR